MDDPKFELVQSWLMKAKHDLGSAHQLIEGSPPFLDTAIYHCQQTVEKALKAFLVWHDIEFEKTHNLSVLIDLCLSKDPDFQSFADSVTELTPYATAYRYPDEFFESEPTPDQVHTALKLSEEILTFVIGKLPDKAPQS